VALDRTRVAIRERSHVELLDLTFHVLRAYARPLLVLLILGALPFALINYWVIGWIPLTASDDIGPGDYGEENLRYYWNSVLLVFLQAPLATAPLTTFLGKAVFVERPTIREALRDTRKSWLNLLLCQGCLRLSLLVTAGMFWLQRGGEYQVEIEGLLLVGAAGWMALIRSTRPFLCEVILLERNPLVAKSKGSMTIGRRMRSLHQANGGEFFARWLSTGLVACLLVYMLDQSALFLQGVFLNDWWHATAWMLHGAFPLALWSVAGYVAVYRFLSYLDTRIRNEGWEVELLVKAEAARLEAQYSEETTLAGS
jgi:hypothetical protein